MDESGLSDKEIRIKEILKRVCIVQMKSRKSFEAALPWEGCFTDLISGKVN